jgi:hypothetical protein
MCQSQCVVWSTVPSRIDRAVPVPVDIAELFTDVIDRLFLRNVVFLYYCRRTGISLSDTGTSNNYSWVRLRTRIHTVRNLLQYEEVERYEYSTSTSNFNRQPHTQNLCCDRFAKTWLDY